MAEIITDLEALGIRSDEIDTTKENELVRDIVLKLKNTIREKGIVSLSAPQIGENKRIFCLAFDGGKNIKTFINPLITKCDGLELNKETCSSIPGKTYIRPRFSSIDIVYTTPMGKVETSRLFGASAKVFQHQIDHIDGILLSDIGLEIGDDFLNATQEEQEEVIKMYMESLDLREKDLKKEIEEDKELKTQYDAITYMSKVATGEIKIERVEEEFENVKKNNDTNA